MKIDERILANKIATYWYNKLHMQHKPIFQKQKLADYIETELIHLLQNKTIAE